MRKNNLIFLSHPLTSETEEFVYRLSRMAFERNGRRIFDATANGKLNVFEKVNFDNLF